jgi:hypothetical protein
MNLHCIIPLLIIGIITFVLMKYQIAIGEITMSLLKQIETISLGIIFWTITAVGTVAIIFIMSNAAQKLIAYTKSSFQRTPTQIAFQQGNWKCTHVPHPWLAGFSEVFCDEYTKIDLLNK